MYIGCATPAQSDTCMSLRVAIAGHMRESRSQTSDPAASPSESTYYQRSLGFHALCTNSIRLPSKSATLAA